MAVQVVFTPNSAFYLGVYVPGAKAEFYQVSTTTPITVYTDNTLGTAHAWPVVADGSGTFPAVWVSGATGVKAIIKDASGATIRTITQAALVPETSSAASGVTFGPIPTNPATNVQQAIENVQADFDGLGTMSAQNASAVTVTGGTINGTNIGATTPATGKFSTLDVSGAAQGALLLRNTLSFAPLAIGTAYQQPRVNAAGTAVEYGPPQIGLGQTWQNVAGSRAVNTSYQNATGRTIMVNIVWQNASAVQYAQVSTDNATWVDVAASTAANASASFLVPDTHYYKITQTSGTTSFSKWAELR